MVTEQSYTTTQPKTKRLQTSIKPESDDLLVLVDVELARVAIGLYLGALLRLWLIGHHVSRERFSGRGWVTVDELWNMLSQIGITMTRRHYRRLLARGNGQFWDIRQKRLFLRSIKFVAEELCIEAGLQGGGLIETNQPGGLKSVWLPIDGSHERWEAFVYAGWLAAHGAPTIARATLSGLFNRADKTLRQWEKTHLAETVNVVPGYAVMNDVAEQPAEHAFYDKAVKSWVYQIPNTYQVALRQTPYDGQRRKVKHAVNPAGFGACGDKKRVYFASFKGLKRALRRSDDPATRFCWLYASGSRFYWRRSADIFV